MKSVVRQHLRRTTTGTTVVKKHLRAIIKKHLKDAEKAVGKKLAHKVVVNTKHKAEGTSLGHTATEIVDGKDSPRKHTVNIDVEKNKKAGQNIEAMIVHEFAHIIDKESVKTTTAKKALITSPKAKALLTVMKNSASFTRLSSKYEKSPEEMFARAYSQMKTGKVKTVDIKAGMAWTKKDFAPIKKELSKLLKK